MLAAKKVGPARADVVEVQVPELGRDDVLVQVRACAICASDLWGWNAPVSGQGNAGEWDPDNPGLTGHEVAGDIAAVGEAIDPERIDEPVWIDPIAGCGKCPDCLEGRQTFCPRVSIVCQGFAQYVVAPAKQCRRIPEGFDYVTASMIGDMAGTPVSAVKRAGVGPGHIVAAWGLGPVGLGFVQASLIAGASNVVGVDPVAARRARAAAFGALTADGADALLEVTSGERPHVVLCSVAAGEAARDGFEVLRPDGRMVTVAGHPPAGGEERKWVSGSWGCDERYWPEVIAHLETRRFVLEDYVTHQFPLSGIECAFSLREHDLARSFKVVIVNE